jgi:hypothetical protein
MKKSRIIILVLLISLLSIAVGCSCAEPAVSVPPVPSFTPEEPSVPPASQQPLSEEIPKGEIASAIDITPISNQQAASTSFTILSLVGGEVLIKRADSDSWETAVTGTVLNKGDVIKSGDGSSAEITFFDGSTIELDQSTQIGLTDIHQSDEGSKVIHIKQDLGNTISRVKKLTDSASSYEVETPAGVASVRGSTLGVYIQPDGSVIVVNIEGDIRVTAEGVEVIIPPGMQSTVKPGEPPSKPEIIPELLPTPTPTTTPLLSSGGGGGGGGSGSSTVVKVVFTETSDVPSIPSGGTVNYAYTVENNGSVRVEVIDLVTDTTGNPQYQSGDTNENSYVDPDETWVYADSYTVTSEDTSPLVNRADLTIYIPYSNAQYILSEQTSVIITPLSQIWYMDNMETGLAMEKSAGTQTGSVPVENGAFVTWLSTQNAGSRFVFNTGTWTVHLNTDDLTGIYTVQIGQFDGESFIPFTGLGSGTADGNPLHVIFPDTSGEIDTNCYLALRFSNSGTGSIFTDGSSYLLAPSSTPSYPVPDVSAGALLLLGLAGLGTFIVIKRKRTVYERV